MADERTYTCLALYMLKTLAAPRSTTPNFCSLRCALISSLLLFPRSVVHQRQRADEESKGRQRILLLST